MATTGLDWRLKNGVASPGNLLILLAVLLSFQLLLRFAGLLAPNVDPNGPLHTGFILKFSLVVSGFLWTCFVIALAGIRRRGLKVQELVGARWHHWQSVLLDLGVALATLLAIIVIGSLSNTLLGPPKASALLWMVPHNGKEAFALLGLTLTAGFVEEFVFRGYLQRQFQALSGNTIVASALQLIVFTQGHAYQGSARLAVVFAIGIVLTIVAIRRKSLVPGMIAHGLGDSLASLAFFVGRL